MLFLISLLSLLTLSSELKPKKTPIYFSTCGPSLNQAIHFYLKQEKKWTVSHDNLRTLRAIYNDLPDSLENKDQFRVQLEAQEKHGSNQQSEFHFALRFKEDLLNQIFSPEIPLEVLDEIADRCNRSAILQKFILAEIVNLYGSKYIVSYEGRVIEILGNGIAWNLDQPQSRRRSAFLLADDKNDPFGGDLDETEDD
jgi:hypothetical protein